jgi:hypothetical protein
VDHLAVSDVHPVVVKIGVEEDDVADLELRLAWDPGPELPVPGVTGVEVDLATGLVTVNSDTAVDTAQIRAAVTEAGYEVVNQS